jgi:predicted nucleic acid-binding protein
LSQLLAARDLMNAVLPAASVVGYEAIIPSVELPDPEDRHVVAAAIAAQASVIVTWNIRDFPSAELRKHGLTKQTPDMFLVALFDQWPDVMVEVTGRARRNLRVSQVSAEEFISALRHQRLVRFVHRIEGRVGEL